MGPKLVPLDINYHKSTMIQEMALHLPGAKPFLKSVMTGHLMGNPRVLSVKYRAGVNWCV